MEIVTTLVLYFAINGQMQKPVKIPMPDIAQCEAALIEGNTLLTPKGMRLVHAECKQTERKQRKGK